MGSLFAALLPSILAAAEPSTLVVLSRKVSVSPAEAAAVVTQVTTLLEEAGAPVVTASEANRRLSKLGLKDATTCNGKAACAAEFGKQLKVEWLILISVSKVAGDRSLALELFDVAGRAVADKESLLLPKGTALTREPLEGFVGRLKAKLSPTLPTAAIPPEKKGDAPLATSLTPETSTVTQLPPPLPLPEPKSHTASFILGGAGVVALGVGIALFVMSGTAQGQVNAGTMGADGRVRSGLTGSQAQAAAGSASAFAGLGVATAAIGLGLGTTAVILW